MSKKRNYVYSYWLPDLNAIKVGYGENPRQRMKNYTNKYNIRADFTSLKFWEMPSSGIAANIENACHKALIAADFVKLSLPDQDSEANELFSLQIFSYDDAVSLVVEEIDDHINYLRKSLHDKNFGDVHRKVKKREELKQRREDEYEQTIQKIMKEISEGYDEHYSRYLSILKEQATHYDSFDIEWYRTSFFVFRKQKTTLEVIKEWGGLEKSIELVAPLLKASRIARSFYHRFHSFTEKNYEEYLIDEAQKRLGFSLYDFPNVSKKYSIHQLQIPYPSVLKYMNTADNMAEYGGRIDMAVYEVYLHFSDPVIGPIGTFAFIKENEKLQTLVKWVRENPCQEQKESKLFII